MHAYQIKSVELMHDKSEKAVQCATNGDLLRARELVDELRFLRATYASAIPQGQVELQQGTNEKNYSEGFALLVNKLNTNFEIIAQWLNAAQGAFSDTHLHLQVTDTGKQSPQSKSINKEGKIDVLLRLRKSHVDQGPACNGVGGGRLHRLTLLPAYPHYKLDD